MRDDDDNNKGGADNNTAAFLREETIHPSAREKLPRSTYCFVDRNILKNNHQNEFFKAIRNVVPGICFNYDFLQFYIGDTCICWQSKYLVIRWTMRTTRS
jgi:hypothetical protein